MTHDDVLTAVLDAIRARNQLVAAAGQMACAPDAKLFAPGSPLDSLGLVALLIDVEDNVAARTGIALTLSDERAMSRSRSPFADVPSLVHLIEERLQEAADRS
jgi:acyl carrier protein